jgi:hypothetical protein
MRLCDVCRVREMAAIVDRGVCPESPSSRAAAPPVIPESGFAWLLPAPFKASKEDNDNSPEQQSRFCTGERRIWFVPAFAASRRFCGRWFPSRGPYLWERHVICLHQCATMRHAFNQSDVKPVVR